MADTATGSYGDVEAPTGAPKLAMPGEIERAINRAYLDMKRDAAKRRFCARLERGDSFSYLDYDGSLQQMATFSASLAAPASSGSVVAGSTS